MVEGINLRNFLKYGDFIPIFVLTPYTKNMFPLYTNDIFLTFGKEIPGWKELIMVKICQLLLRRLKLIGFFVLSAKGKMIAFFTLRIENTLE